MSQATGILPTALRAVRVPLIPKPNRDGKRPVGILPAFYQVHAAATKSTVISWEQQMIDQHSFLTASVNRGAADAVWRQGVTAQVTRAIATRLGTPAHRIVGVGALFDLKRFVDSIPPPNS